MPLLVLETLIEAAPALCYNLALSVEWHQEATRHTRAHVIAGVREGILQPGETVTWRAKHFGLWLTLTTQITQAQPVHYFVEEMRQGAFHSLKHEHYFFPHAQGTLMKDVFRFELPLGYLGKLINLLVLEGYLSKLLLGRNQSLKAIAEADCWKAFVPSSALR